MRKIAVLILAPFVALVVAMAVFVSAWLRDRRTGSRFMNDIVNPFLVRNGIAGAGQSEVGTLEHIGRRSGTRRLTPVYPVPTPEGFRIIVPLGPESQWARNVVSAGHCRMQLRDTLYELDEPLLVNPVDVRELPGVARRLFGALGFQFLLLRQFSAASGTLEPVAPAAVLEEPAWAPDLPPTAETEPGAAPVEEPAAAI